MIKDTPQDDSMAEIVSTRIWNKAIQRAVEIVKAGGITSNIENLNVRR